MRADRPQAGRCPRPELLSCLATSLNLKETDFLALKQSSRALDLQGGQRGLLVNPHLPMQVPHHGLALGSSAARRSRLTWMPRSR